MDTEKFHTLNFQSDHMANTLEGFAFFFHKKKTKFFQRITNLDPVTKGYQGLQVTIGVLKRQLLSGLYGERRMFNLSKQKLHMRLT